MSKIDISQLRTVLGVSTLYTDDDLISIANAADSLVDGLLNYNKATISLAQIKDNVATFFTANANKLYIGAGITVSNCGSPFDGTRTVKDAGSFWFTADLTAADTEAVILKPYGSAILTTQIGLWDETPAVREAALAIAVEIFQQRVTPGGMIQAVDYTPSPHKLGRALLTRVHGLLAPYMDMGSFVG